MAKDKEQFPQGRPPERKLKDPVVMQVKISRHQRKLLADFAVREGLLYNGQPSRSQAVSELIDRHC